MAAQYRYQVKSGVFIYSVEKGYAAEKAGLQMGDVIVKIDDKKISNVEDLNVAKKSYSAGDSAVVTFYRQNEEMTVEIVWDAVPADQQATKQEQVPQNGSGNQYGNGYYSDPFSFFDYFFGNAFGY